MVSLQTQFSISTEHLGDFTSDTIWLLPQCFCANSFRPCGSDLLWCLRKLTYHYAQTVFRYFLESGWKHLSAFSSSTVEVQHPSPQKQWTIVKLEAKAIWKQPKNLNIHLWRHSYSHIQNYFQFDLFPPSPKRKAMIFSCLSRRCVCILHRLSPCRFFQEQGRTGHRPPMHTPFSFFQM